MQKMNRFVAMEYMKRDKCRPKGYLKWWNKKLVARGEPI